MNASAIEVRRTAFLRVLCAVDLTKDIHGGAALVRLAAGVDIEASNAKLRDVAYWFVLPHPTGRDPQGESDFAALKLCWAYHQFNATNLLTSDTLEAIREYFLRFDFQSKYTSENHQLLFHTSRYLMASAYADDVFGRYGVRGATLAQWDHDYLVDFLRFRAKQGWEEFDSSSYIAPGWECLCALHDFAPDADLRCAARMMLHVRLMDVIADSLEGMHCGAHGRIYERHALDHRNACTYFLQDLYFGNVCSRTAEGPPVGCVVEALLSVFEPDPLLGRIVSNRRMPYESRERTHLHCSTYVAPQRPLPQESGSIHKLTVITAQYALGCVQWQDPYPEGSQAAWYRGHQQHDWDLTFAGGDTRRRIFTHHPGQNGAEGKEHGYWTGDMFCCCSAHFQQGTVALSLYDIPSAEPYQWIHAYLPRALFEEIVEEEAAIYVRHGDTYAMLRFAHPYAWTKEGKWKDVEVICPGSQHAVACEVGTAQTHGSFPAFLKEMRANPLTLDAASGCVSYASRRNGHLLLSKAERLVDGKPAPLAYDTYDSPYMHAAWDSGICTITDGASWIRCDFNALQMTIE